MTGRVRFIDRCAMWWPLGPQGQPMTMRQRVRWIRFLLWWRVTPGWFRQARLTQWLQNPREYEQVTIRTHSMAGYLVEHLDARVDVVAARSRGRRAARRLALLCGLAPRHAEQVERVVLARWATDPAILSGAELRGCVSAPAATS